MSDQKKYSKKRQYKFIFLLSLLITYVIVSPARASDHIYRVPAPVIQLNEFEGYYHSDKDSNLFLQIMIKDNKLVLKQLWDDQEITFEQKSALYFYNDEHSFPITFSKSANGEITQLLAFERDTWIKAKDYNPVAKKEITLTAEKMQAFAGRYKISDGNEESILQFTVNGNSLDVKELWSGKIFTIVPETDLVFFGKKVYYPVQFSKDKDGNITQALIYNKDVWMKVKE